MPEYADHSVRISPSVGADVVLGGITSGGLPTNTETTTDNSGASVVQTRSISKQEPVYNFTTQSISAALGVFGMDGTCFGSGKTVESVTRYMEAKKDCTSGTPASNGHAAYAFSEGLVTLQELSASRGETATLSIQVDPTTDSTGANAPFAESYAATLPTTIDLDQYVLGAVRIGGIVMADVRDATFSFGNEQTEKLPQLAGVWPQTVGVKRTDPRLTVSGRDLTRLASGAVPLTGKSAVHTDTEVWFRKRQDGSAMVATATTVHFKLTMSGMAICEEAASGSGNENASTTFTVLSTYDGTNFPIVATRNIAYAPGF